MQQSYQRVARSLDRDPWRFWAPPDGFEARYKAALKATLLAWLDLSRRQFKAQDSM